MASIELFVKDFPSIMAIITTHSYSSGASEDCILTLRDTASEFLHKLTSLMRVAVEHQTSQGTSGFAVSID